MFNRGIALNEFDNLILVAPLMSSVLLMLLTSAPQKKFTRLISFCGATLCLIFVVESFLHISNLGTFERSVWFLCGVLLLGFSSKAKK